MSNQQTNQQATYCGESVEIIHVEQNAYGLCATILFEDGHEDEVPYKSLKFN